MIKVDVIEKSTWDSTLGAVMHARVFNVLYKPESDKIDYALLSYTEDKNEPIAYATIHELDESVAYMKFGGVLPEYRNSLMPVRSFRKFIEILKEKYCAITMKVENTNNPMLRLAMSEGFLIVGTNHVFNSTMLEHLLLVKEKQNG